MILAVLGTHPAPMRRLELWLEHHAASTGERCVVQGATGEAAQHLEHAGIVSPLALGALIDEAHVIITHGGPGSIMAVVARGRHPIVIPRNPLLGEHVDAHQERFAAWLATKRPITVVSSLAELSTLVEFHRTAARAGDVSVGPSDGVLNALRAIISASSHE